MPHVISADVGGTNSRFQLHSSTARSVDADGQDNAVGHEAFELVCEMVLKSAEFTSLGALVVRVRTCHMHELNQPLQSTTITTVTGPKPAPLTTHCMGMMGCMR